jgi:hypothetical protein
LPIQQEQSALVMRQEKYGRTSAVAPNIRITRDPDSQTHSQAVSKKMIEVGFFTKGVLNNAHRSDETLSVSAAKFSGADDVEPRVIYFQSVLMF